jgi:hypothetical protein
MLFGWALVAAMHSQGITTLVFPVSQLVVLAAAPAHLGTQSVIPPMPPPHLPF